VYVPFLVYFALWYNKPLFCNEGELIYVGIKEWTLIAPEDAHYLMNPTTDTLPRTIDSQQAQFPFLGKAREKAIVVRQYPGETIFVPSGWYHQVQNHGFPLLHPRPTNQG